MHVDGAAPFVSLVDDHFASLGVSQQPSDSCGNQVAVEDSQHPVGHIEQGEVTGQLYRDRLVDFKPSRFLQGLEPVSQPGADILG